ncbi:MAG: hypothetical protein PHU25_09795 [Deltaproteobacteria bacterium]|nr:hypothetical protein [Deltaproteobacteria bacterium]
MRQPSPDRCHFPKDIVDEVLAEQGNRCPCCHRPLEKVFWHQHHRTGDIGDLSKRHLVCACFDCHLYCYHDGNWHNPPREPTSCSGIC